MVDVIVLESGSKEGSFLKILAEINLAKPLLSGTKIRCKDKEVWVEFKYESMAMFCFYCGRVGHQERNCSNRKKDANDRKLVEGQYWDWLRADIIREGYKMPRSVNVVKQKGSSQQDKMGNRVRIEEQLQVLENWEGGQDSGGVVEQVRTDEPQSQDKQGAGEEQGKEIETSEGNKGVLREGDWHILMSENGTANGINQPHLTNEVQWMILDSEEQSAILNGLDNLVNVPIQLPVGNGVLRERK